MYNDFIAQVEIHQHEVELAKRLELRRIAAERAAQQHGGSRLAVVAHLARRDRAARGATVHPAG